ncbi:MAG: hypothetical protein QOG99_360 [Frankiales bacterium]|nr:hypothetical protein [Frankiales bacterium]
MPMTCDTPFRCRETPHCDVLSQNTVTPTKSGAGCREKGRAVTRPLPGRIRALTGLRGVAVALVVVAQRGCSPYRCSWPDWS